jgi:hypothetical protein
MPGGFLFLGGARRASPFCVPMKIPVTERRDQELSISTTRHGVARLKLAAFGRGGSWTILCAHHVHAGCVIDAA